MNEQTNNLEVSIVEMGRLKLVKEMFDLLTPEEKHAIALKYVDDWVAKIGPYRFAQLIETGFREAIEVEVKEQLKSKIDHIRAEVARHIDAGTLENEVWQSATWKLKRELFPPFREKPGDEIHHRQE